MPIWLLMELCLKQIYVIVIPCIHLLGEMQDIIPQEDRKGTAPDRAVAEIITSMVYESLFSLPPPSIAINPRYGFELCSLAQSSQGFSLTQ